jgi:hypothetical protein
VTSEVVTRRRQLLSGPLSLLLLPEDVPECCDLRSRALMFYVRSPWISDASLPMQKRGFRAMRRLALPFLLCVSESQTSESVRGASLPADSLSALRGSQKAWRVRLNPHVRKRECVASLSEGEGRRMYVALRIRARYPPNACRRVTHRYS